MLVNGNLRNGIPLAVRRNIIGAQDLDFVASDDGFAICLNLVTHLFDLRFERGAVACHSPINGKSLPATRSKRGGLLVIWALVNSENGPGFKIARQNHRVLRRPSQI